MSSIRAIIRLLEGLTESLGRLAAWFSVLMILVTCYIVVTRYGFNRGSIAVQESVTYLNAMLFMLCAAFTLRHNGHVRVDILYSQASPRYRAWTDLLGGLFLLLPVCVFLILVSWNYVGASWSIREESPDAGGLAWVYLLKTLIPVMGGLLILQGLADILRNALRLAGQLPFDDAEYGEPGRKL